MHPNTGISSAHAKSQGKSTIAGSEQLISRAKKSIAGGASSSMRVLDYHQPLAITEASGALIRDPDGNELIDLNMGYGPLIFGHQPSIVIDAIKKELDQLGTVLGFPHEISHQVGELVKKSFPSVDLLRFASTGTEVCQTAVRLARAYTGRKYLVLFEGHYHGSSDAVYHQYHAPLDLLEQRKNWEAVPGTGGMGGAPVNVLVVPWNNLEVLSELFDNHGDEIAAVMMEPIMGNAGVIPPRTGFLQAVREQTKNHGALLVFDEVITGFRVARGGAQELYGVAADITTFSKALGGGIPVSAIGGRSDIMKLMVDGTVFHGGVYSGNPMCLAAALATQQAYETNEKEIYTSLWGAASRLAEGLASIFQEIGIPIIIQNAGPMLSLWFANTDDVSLPGNYREVVTRTNHPRFIAFQHAMQESGVYFHPNHFEPWYIATAHTQNVIDRVLEQVRSTATGFDWSRTGN